MHQPVRVRRGADDRPCGFAWRGRWHPVAEILDTWVYRSPWWRATPLEETFYRVRTAEGGLYELAEDGADRYRMHRIYD